MTEKAAMLFGGYTVSFEGVTNVTMEQLFGDKPITPAQMTKVLWDYVKRNGLARKP